MRLNKKMLVNFTIQFKLQQNLIRKNAIACFYSYSELRLEFIQLYSRNSHEFLSNRCSSQITTHVSTN